MTINHRLRYSPEWAGGVFSTLRDWLAPHLIGKDISTGEELQAVLSIFKGNPFAKAGLDVAFWNLAAKVEGKPLHELLGNVPCTSTRTRLQHCRTPGPYRGRSTVAI